MHYNEKECVLTTPDRFRTLVAGAGARGEHRGHRRRCRQLRTIAGGFLLLVLTGMALTGCSSAVQVATGKVAEIALSAVGVKLPASNSSANQPKTVHLHLVAADDLNATESGQGLSTVVRIYELRDRNGFLAAPYASFGAPEQEKIALGADLIGVHELRLTPGQTVDLQEKVPATAAYLGIVSLFRAPDPNRWRFAFATAGLDDKPVAIGLHACAMTASSIAPAGMPLSESALLAPVRCE